MPGLSLVITSEVLIDDSSAQARSGPEPEAVTAPPRIDLGKLARLFLFVLVLPMMLAWVADGVFGSTPIVTIAAIVILIPAAAILIIRTSLLEMDRVIQIVAPPEPDVQQDTQDSGGPTVDVQTASDGTVEPVARADPGATR